MSNLDPNSAIVNISSIQFKDAAQEIDDIRNGPGQAWQKHREMSRTVLHHLFFYGKLYVNKERDPYGTPYLFVRATKEMIELEDGNTRFRQILVGYGLSVTEKAYAYTLEAIRDEAHQNGTETKIRSFAHYDEEKNVLYVSNGPSHIIKITPNQITEVENGTDGMIFLDGTDIKPFEYNADFPHGIYQKTITNSINFADDVLRAAERATLFDAWVYSLFFRSILPSKPILAFIGTKGSGKTTALKRLSALFYQNTEAVGQIPTSSDDFDTITSNNHLVVFDNADGHCPWLNDKLSACATGAVVHRRKLYTTNTLEKYRTDCFLGITSRTPRFRRDDVADRLLMMQVKPYPEDQRVPEKKLLGEVSSNRDACISEMLHHLQEMLVVIGSDTLKDTKPMFRMADFAMHALAHAAVTDDVSSMQRSIARLSNEQSDFTLDGDPIFEPFASWMEDPANWNREISKKDLWGELRSVAEREKIDFRNYAENFPGFTRRFANIRSDIEEKFIITDHPGRSRKMSHSFSPRSAEESQ